MRTQTKKDTEYLNGNPIVKSFIDEVNESRKRYHEKHLSNLTFNPIVFEVGSKYIRLWADTYCWGFIARKDGILKGSPIKCGDLLKPATWKAPAKHARGNIIDGTAKWGVYGPEYL
jgi:hypothetical protein